jgi:hypothetical protein
MTDQQVGGRAEGSPRKDRLVGGAVLTHEGHNHPPELDRYCDQQHAGGTPELLPPEGKSPGKPLCEGAP